MAGGLTNINERVTEKWCRWRESNSHERSSLPPQGSASTNSATSAKIKGWERRQLGRQALAPQMAQQLVHLLSLHR